MGVIRLILIFFFTIPALVYCYGQETAISEPLDVCVEKRPNFFQRFREKHRTNIYSKPEPVGGIQNYINKIKAVLSKKDLKTEGMVFVKIEINRHGERKTIKVIKAPSRLSGNTVKRAIKEIDQKFIPATGQRNGKSGNYKSDILLPIRTGKG